MGCFPLSDGATSSTETIRHATSLDVSIPEPLLNEALGIYVNTNTFTLNVVQNGEILWQFPVGAGAGNSTPSGSFSLGTKLIDPTWYNNGDPVAAGSPENPLGNRWMGLSRGTVATPIGLHPTNSKNSIGQGASKGCIRMRPDDARLLFAMVPLGTPIVIDGFVAQTKL